MPNTIKKCRQSSIVFEKPGILSENLKTLTSSNYSTVQYFCWNFAHIFSYHCLQKGVRYFFLFYLDLELLVKIKKYLVSAHSFFTILLITYDLTNTNKFHTLFCRHYYVENVCKISAKNIKIYRNWSSSKFSIFQTKNVFCLK